MNIIVNGKPIVIEANPGEMLSDLLRDRLGLTGTKIGCNEAECGSCTVLVDGDPVLSCTYPAARAEGKTIVTVEGLASAEPVPAMPVKEAELQEDGDTNLHPLQEAFVQYGAVQCGFCIPGQLMTSYALLQRNPDPSEEEIRHALKDTLCRCAGYPTIVRAVQAAAESMRTGQPVAPPQQLSSAEPMEVIGTMQLRPDAVAKVNGKAKFTDDLKFENMLYARAKRAGIPHAFVKRIDVEKARNLPGVAAVLTAADIPGEHNHGLVIYDWPAIIGIGERVRYVGDTTGIDLNYGQVS